MIFQNKRKKVVTLKDLITMGLLIALSVVGAQIKIQGSIAFDSLPAFFAALYMGPVMGGIIGLLGHLVSAMTAGFQLTLPMHLIVSLQMFVIVAVFGVVWKKINPLVAIIIGILLNGPGAALLAVPVSIFLGLPFSGWPLFLVIWVSLTVASTLNILLAAILYNRLKGRGTNGGY